MMAHHSISVRTLTRATTSSKTSWQGAELRCVWVEPMALCVMTPGTIRMPLWSADNWDSPPMVS